MITCIFTCCNKYLETEGRMDRGSTSEDLTRIQEKRLLMLCYTAPLHLFNKQHIQPTVIMSSATEKTAWWRDSRGRPHYKLPADCTWAWPVTHSNQEGNTWGRKSTLDCLERDKKAGVRADSQVWNIFSLSVIWASTDRKIRHFVGSDLNIIQHLRDCHWYPFMHRGTG